MAGREERKEGLGGVEQAAEIRSRRRLVSGEEPCGMAMEAECVGDEEETGLASTSLKA